MGFMVPASCGFYYVGCRHNVLILIDFLRQKLFRQLNSLLTRLIPDLVGEHRRNLNTGATVLLLSLSRGKHRFKI